MNITSVVAWRASPAHLRAVLLGVTSVSAALLFRVPMLLVLGAPFLAIAVWGAVTRPDGEPVLDGRLAPSTLREGEVTSWRCRADGLGGVDHVVALAPRRDWLDLRPESGVSSAIVDDGGPATLDVSIRATHWGRHEVGRLKVVAVSAWGAFRWSALDVGHRLTVLPVPAPFDANPSTLRADGLVGVNRSARPGDGNEFSGIRPFRAGDRLRRINWKRSSREGQLHVTETFADRDTHVALIVDGLADHGTSGGIDGEASSLDTTVRAAGAVAEHFLLRGDRVSLRVVGSRLFTDVPPAAGSGHLRRILDVLATIEPQSRRSVSARGAATVPGGALAIMLSPLISPAALERAITLASHGLTVAVVDTLPQGVHVDDDPTTELAWRIRLLERAREVRSIQRLGVPVIAWTGPGSLDPFLRDLARLARAPRLVRR
ncbi:MAG: DUF58 domain-containing protein [Actinomycetota bacterium]